ncbi:type II secretion system F family protein [Mitsuokella sp. WILCCON 0060]|uniref:type II secretion system F family protein n=1 Tax=Mitsuokella sp. WILCCON 0060 TaxID=3345341 RepID=UPI003F19C66A
MSALLAVLVTAMCFFLLVMLLSIRSREDRVITERLSSLAEAPGETRQSRQGGGLKALILGLIESLATAIGKVQRGRRVELWMQQADWPIHGTEFEAILVLWGLFIGFITFLVTLKASMFFLGALAAILLGFALLGLRIRRRRKKFTNQLGDMLTMVANALRAGFSFMQAFELIAREMDAPMGREVRLVVNEVNLGNTLETALDNMQRRVASPDFELVVTAVLIQRQVGGDLAQILDTISETIEERIRMRREVMALTAQGRASAVVVACIPIALAAGLSILNPDYLKPLIETDMGHMFIIGAVVLEIIGMLIIRKIVDIKA